MPLTNTPSFKQVTDKMMEVPQPAINGLNLKDLEYEQEVGQSPYMLNMMYRNGAFSKRYGQAIYDNTIYVSEVPEIHNTIVYRGSLFRHIGTRIEKDHVVIKQGLTEQVGLFILFNQKLYYFIDKIYEIYYDTDQYKLLQYRPSDWTTNWTNYYIYNGGAYVHLTDVSAPMFKQETYFKANTNYNTWVCDEVIPYIPTITINRKPDGTGGDTSESYNMVGTGFQNKFNGDGTSTEYYLTDKGLDSGASDLPIVFVDNEQWTYDANLSAAKTFKVDYQNGKITLKSAAPSGSNNVEISAFKHDNEWTEYHDQVLASKYYSCFGGNNNSRLFVAGGGKSTYYYSEVYDISYFPYTNFARVGNSADDITGFGQQYNVLIVFKPTEIYSLTYYQVSSDDTYDESQYGLGAFSSQIVNSSIGCDCPYTIQLINNSLVWYSSKNGVCTLVSTNIQDERNVRTISRNIDKTNNFNVKGILDINLKRTNTITGNVDSINDTVVSLDFDNKYFLVFPKEYTNSDTPSDCGLCYVWDYLISPYVVTSSSVTNPKDLTWFLFDHFFVKKFTIFNNKAIYTSYLNLFKGQYIELNDSFIDLDFNNDGDLDPIKSYYMTPFFQFDAVEYLKTIKNIYIQCRGDTASKIDIYYYTDESNVPTQDSESIIIGGKLWNKFDWTTFEWTMVNWSSVFRRKCSLKKVQMASFYFKNEEEDRDMSISHIALQYQIVKNIK